MSEQMEYLGQPSLSQWNAIQEELKSLRSQLVMAVETERERCAKICDEWVSRFGKGSIQYVPATEYATDAVCDIADLIRKPQPCSHAAIIGLDGKWHCQKCGNAIDMACAHTDEQGSSK